MRDEVDDLIAAWSRERPDLPVEPMQVWSRIKRLEQYLDAARRQAYSEHGLEVWEFDVLAALRRAGEPCRLSPGQLIRETHVTSGTMTNRVARLTQRGFVQRLNDPADGRGALVQLTAEGKDVVDAAMSSLLAMEASLLSTLPAGAAARLGDDLRLLLLQQG